MPVWWGTLIYALFVSAVGMSLYKSKLQINSEVKLSSEKADYRSIGIVFALLSFALLVFFVGNRDYIFDSFDYQYAYTNYYSTELNQIPKIWNGEIKGKGKMYMTILVLFKHFSGGADYHAWFTFLALFECFSVAVFFYKYSVDYKYSIFMYMTTGCFLWLINGVRQFLAIAVILLFIDWLKNKKWIPFLLVVVFAYFIHDTAIIFLPVCFFIHFKPWSPKFLAGAFILVVILVLLPSNLGEESNYTYLSQINNRMNPIRAIAMSVPTILAFIKRKDIRSKGDSLINILVNLSVLLSACYIVGCLTSGIIARISGYFQLFPFVLLPWMYKNVFDENISRIIKNASYVGYLLYFCYDMYIAGNGIYQSIGLNLYYF